MAQVSLLRCDSYDPDLLTRTIQQSLVHFGGMASIVKPGQKVLCKVSMLRGAAPDEAVTTHPAVAQAVATLVKDAGGEAWIGDSCGGADYGLSEKALEKCGFVEAAKRSGAKIVLFETAGTQTVEVRHGRFLETLHVSKAVTDADVIVNLPKLKTHIETLMTGGVKNMMGCLPGAGKLLVHRTAPSPWDLGNALLDIYSTLRPAITIMDAVVAMQGNGPSRGTPAPIGAILAATDAVALDHVAARLLGYDPDKVPTLAPAADRGLGETRTDAIEILGESLVDMKPKKFKRASNVMMRSMPKPVLRLLNRRYFKVQPRWDEKGCDLCGLCVDSCPVEAMQQEGETILIDYDKCIQCFCCHELCPSKGITIYKTLLAKMLS